MPNNPTTSVINILPLLPQTEWATVLAEMDTTTPEPELDEWDITLGDGLEG